MNTGSLTLKSTRLHKMCNHFSPMCHTMQNMGTKNFPRKTLWHRNMLYYRPFHFW